jgi:dihydroflavonol-4-reductase
MRGVIHTAAWVSLRIDPAGVSQAINVDATNSLLIAAREASASRFVFTSTLHTLASGTRNLPADEACSWNLDCVDSPYSRTKRQAESLVRGANEPGFETIVLCPGMVLGPRDPKPTSTKLLRTLAKTPVAVVPRGGIPILDASVAAIAHRRALLHGEPGERYAIVGPYLSYRELAELVALVSGRPWTIVAIPSCFEPTLKRIARCIDRLGVNGEISETTVAGGFLQLHVSGRRGNECFDLVHPAPIDTIRRALQVDQERAELPGNP